jgi:hypothetical protein
MGILSRTEVVIQIEELDAALTSLDRVRASMLGKLEHIANEGA